MVHNIITNSMGKDDICMSKESAQAMQDLRKFMFANLYNNPVAKSEEKKAKAMLKQLYFYYMEHIEELPQKYLVMLEQGDDKGRIICDYISHDRPVCHHEVPRVFRTGSLGNRWILIFAGRHK